MQKKVDRIKKIYFLDERRGARCHQGKIQDRKETARGKEKNNSLP